MPLQFTPYSGLSVVSVIALLILTLVIWRRRPGAGVIPFVAMLSGVMIWSLANALELTFTKLAIKEFLSSFVYIGITIVPASWLLFSLEYTGRDRWVTRRNVLLLTIEPLLTLIFAFTNRYHNLFWSQRVLDTSGSFVLMVSTHGPAFWVHAAYSYIILVISTGFLIEAFIRSPHLYRGQVGWLLLGSFAPWVANALFIFSLSPLPDYVDLTPLAFTITGLAVGWSMYRYQLMDIVPVARDTVIEGIGEAVLVLDRNNRVVDANPAALQLLNTTSQAAIGHTLAEMLPDRQDLIEAYRNVEHTSAEIAIDLAGGQKREFKMTISPLLTRQGNSVGRVIVLHDISELKQANRDLEAAREKAEEANLLKSQFLATMSHELRTPLNAINGFTEILLEGMAGPLTERQTSNLERVHANARDLRQLIDDLLDLAKIEAGRTEIIKKPFAVGKWLDEITEQTRALADEKKLRVITRLDPNMPEKIVGDPGRLKQIAFNLISNAVKFTEAGEIEISVQREGESRWMLNISDTGIGIPSHALEYIFEKFRQVDGQATRKHGGSGLGLAIVRNLALMMGGNVRVNSEVGKGTTFTVLLPLTVAEATEPEPQIASAG